MFKVDIAISDSDSRCFMWILAFLEVIFMCILDSDISGGSSPPETAISTLHGKNNLQKY